MSNALEEITKKAVLLPRKERLELAGLLLDLDDRASDQQLQSIWEQEIVARIHAIDERAVEGISFDEVMLEAEKRLDP